MLMRLRSHGLLAWDAQSAVYRVTPMARNVLSALDTLLSMGAADDEAEMGFLLSQVAWLPRRSAASPSNSSSTCWAAWST
ncbi:hypothetical protein LP420_15720 [Massilia sp. B-10]|nr:hypothetical protein LP420_15720 [Massilia sp. B-10]